MLLNELFGDKKLSDLKQNVIITSSDYTLEQLRVFDSINVPKNQNFLLTKIRIMYISCSDVFRSSIN